MCPARIASAALMVSSVVSTGGLTAVLVKKFGARRGVKTVGSKIETKGRNDAIVT